MTTAEQAKAELRSLMHGAETMWLYAYAYGHGCSVNDHPQFRALRERSSHLRAIIAEHREHRP